MLKFKNNVDPYISSDIQIVFVTENGFLYQDDSFEFPNGGLISIVGFDHLENYVRKVLEDADEFVNYYLNGDLIDSSRSVLENQLFEDQEFGASIPEDESRKIPSVFTDREIRNFVWFMVKNPKYLPTKIVAWLYDESGEDLPQKEDVLLIRYSE